jgi:diguanylate cyclase (GGDEF)-like protein
MFFWMISVSLLVALFSAGCVSVQRLRVRFKRKERNYEQNYVALKKEEDLLSSAVDGLESDLSEKYLFYDTARRIAPFFDRKHLLETFGQEIKYLGDIDDLVFAKPFNTNGYKVFKFGRGASDVFYIKTSSKAVLDYMSSFVKLLELCSDKIKLYDKLQKLSIYDHLTKIYNRRYFSLRYSEEFGRATRLGLTLSFLMIDIDYFKKINDTYGHLVGDVVLRAVAKTARKSLREMDFIARFGGEEFAVILPETDKAGAIMVADRISARVSREKIRAFDEVINVTLSIGVATYPQNTLYPDVLVEAADKALYKAKTSGRNRVSWF